MFADTYQYTDEAGELHLSNVPGGNARYQLVLKTEAMPTKNTQNKPRSKTKISTSQKFTNTSPELLAQIKKSAQKNKIESELIQAVIHVESAYNPKASCN